MASGGDSADPDQELYLQFLKFKRQREQAQELAVKQAASFMAHTSPMQRHKIGKVLSHPPKDKTGGSAAQLQKAAALQIDGKHY
jgi:hypothetical protein